jgi:hypothetical protein
LDTSEFLQINRLITDFLSGESAKNLDRPGMERLLALVEERKQG